MALWLRMSVSLDHIHLVNYFSLAFASVNEDNNSIYGIYKLLKL